MDPKCDVSWCSNAAEHVWYRSAADMKALTGKSSIGVQPERKVCTTHRPDWRLNVYLPIGTLRPEELTTVRPERKTKHCKGCQCKAIA